MAVDEHVAENKVSADYGKWLVDRSKVVGELGRVVNPVEVDGLRVGALTAERDLPAAELRGEGDDQETVVVDAGGELGGRIAGFSGGVKRGVRRKWSEWSRRPSRGTR